MANVFASAAYNASHILDGGSRHAYIKAVLDASGAATNPADGFVHMPVKMEWKFNPSTSKTELTMDDGTKYTTNTETSVELTYKTGQKDDASVQEFFKAADGKWLLMIVEGDESASITGSKYPYYSYLCKIDGIPGHGSKVQPEYKFTVYQPTSTITVNFASDGDTSGTFGSFGAKTGTLTHTASEWFGYAELAAA